MARKPSPLDDLRIASPCEVPWDSMAGDERVRFCSYCQLHVYNLSAMSRPEAEAIARRRETERVCIGFYRRADGTVLTQDCPVGAALKRLRAARRRLCLLALAAVVLLVAVFAWFTGWLGERGDAKERARRVRDAQPFKMVLNWVDPEPAPPRERQWIYGW